MGKTDRPKTQQEAFEQGIERLQNPTKKMPRSPIEQAFEQTDRMVRQKEAAKKAKERVSSKVKGASDIPRLLNIVNGTTKKPVSTVEQQQAAAKIRDMAKQVEVNKGDYVVGTNARGDNVFIERSEDGSSVRLFVDYKKNRYEAPVGDVDIALVISGSKSKFKKSPTEVMAEYNAKQKKGKRKEA
jgi:hypothetical protein